MYKIIFALYCVLLTVLLAGCGPTEAPASARRQRPSCFGRRPASHSARRIKFFVEGSRPATSKACASITDADFLHRDWCSLCHEMADEAFTNETSRLAIGAILSACWSTTTPDQPSAASPRAACPTIPVPFAARSAPQAGRGKPTGPRSGDGNAVGLGKM